MAQFDVRRNANPASAKVIPFLLEVQADLLGELSTRVVVPLAKIEAVDNKPARTLNPVVEVGGEVLVMLTPEMAGVSVKHLGPVVTSVIEKRDEILRALDVVFSGV